MLFYHSDIQESHLLTVIYRRWNAHLFLKCEDKQKSTEVPEIHWSYLKLFYGSDFFSDGICCSNTVFLIGYLLSLFPKSASLLAVPAPCLIAALLVPSTSHTTSDRLCCGVHPTTSESAFIGRSETGEAAEVQLVPLWRGWRHSHLLPTAAPQNPRITMMTSEAWGSHSRTVFLVWDEGKERWGKLASFI